MNWRIAAGAVVFLLGCASRSSSTSTPEARQCVVDQTYPLTPDLGSVNEAYLCYGFSAASFDHQTLQGLVWTPPEAGGVVWHHATVYAVPGDFPDGPCDGMPPDAVGLHVWAPGGSDLVLPDGVGLALPEHTTRLVVEMHVLRTSSQPPATGSLGLCLSHEPVAHPAMFFGAVAPVPAIRPQMQETSKAACSFHGDAHLWSVWPHMHLVGSAIQATLIRANGATSVLSRVDPWNFHQQKTYPLDVDVHSGDSLEVQCWWTNPTTDYVLPGLKTSNEMCNHGFIGWPAASLPCEETP
jgi:hypothetical protein